MRGCKAFSAQRSPLQDRRTATMGSRPDEQSGDERTEDGFNDDTEQQKRLKWYAYCPAGDVCSKGGKTLGGFWSESRARDAIFSHLRNSPYHCLSKEEASDGADMAELQCHEEDEDWQQDNACGSYQNPSTKSKAAPGKKRPKSPDPQPGQKRPRGSGSASSTSILATRTPAPASLDAALKTQTKNAVIFTRSMAKAEKALRLAAKVSRSAMETFQDRVPYKGFESRAASKP